MENENPKPITADGMMFINTRARCLYIGKTTRERPKWLQDNPDQWRPLTVIGRATSAASTEQATRPNGAADLLLPPTKQRLSEDEPAAPAVLPAVHDPQTQSADDEIIID